MTGAPPNNAARAPSGAWIEMGTSSPVATHIGRRISPAGIRRPQGLTRASATSNATRSMQKVRRLRAKKPPSSITTGFSTPRLPPANQMIFRTM